MISLSVGSQLYAPQGFQHLTAGATYYLLRSSPTTGLARLVTFLPRGPTGSDPKNRERRARRQPTADARRSTPHPLLITLIREDFELALGTYILPCAEQQRLPPWLGPLEGKNLNEVSKRRRPMKKSHEARIDSKLAIITPLIEDAESLLDADDPERLLNKFAATHPLRPHPVRVRLWFFCYLLFGRSRDALHYAIQNIGRWSRAEHPGHTKRGRPHRNGPQFGCNVDAAMIAKIAEAFWRFATEGQTMKKIYLRALREIFGCRVVVGKSGGSSTYRVYHPAGDAFPSFKTFEYHVYRLFGHQAVRAKLYGESSARSRIRPEAGSFTERTWNVMQDTQEDGRYIKERPLGYVDGSTLPPLCEVRLVDLASGILAGVGYSQGAERNSAYRAALFCAAINKVKFCSLFGLTIDPWDWPSEGLSPNHLRDRGPGASSKAYARDSEHHPAVQVLAPSYAGQSKANVESTHPRALHIIEPPSFVQSNLRTVELVKQQILQAIRENGSRDVSSRVTPKLINHLENVTPNELWNELSARGRSDAIRMPFDTAVRQFLDKHPARLSRKGVSVAGLQYNSEALKTTACAELSGNQTLKVDAYVLAACVRHVWLEWKGQLLELDIQYAGPLSELEQHMSLAEAVQFTEALKKRQARLREQKDAQAIAHDERAEMELGKSPHATKKVRGRPKKTALARQEAREAMR